MRILPRHPINPLIRTMPPPAPRVPQPQLDIIRLVRRKVKLLLHTLRFARLRIRRRPGPMDLEHGRTPGIPPPLPTANRRGIIAAIPTGPGGTRAVRRPKRREELGQQRTEGRQTRAGQGGREFADGPARGLDVVPRDVFLDGEELYAHDRDGHGKKA